MAKPPLCLNMIVKNEGARIERCLRSVLPHVKCAAIVDTGSTDDTIDKIRVLCEEHGVPVWIKIHPFVDFSDARNEAWRYAKSYLNHGLFPARFALLMDADMVLVVDDPNAFMNLDANALSYDMMQKGGAVSYANRRIVNLNVGTSDIYVGSTHEYIDLESAGMIEGARFDDFADGANRTDKYVRDIALLKGDIEKDPTSERSWFYLANSYRDAGQPLLAIDAYTKRIELGGWDEEIHNAMMNRAQAYLDAGFKHEFAMGMLEAFNYRPRRAEPLYDLAKHFREKGDNALAHLYAKEGLSIPKPNDLLFVNDFVYSHGLRYEYSIAAYYNEAERRSAFEVTNALALDRSCPADYRQSARSNLYWHLQPLSAYCPSFQCSPLPFSAPAGYTPMNPSVMVSGGQIKVNIRCVNYRINDAGQYMIGETGCGDAPIDTRNFIATLNWDLGIEHTREIIWHRPPAAWGLVTGLEDIRLWTHFGELHFSATVREQSERGECEMWAGRLAYDIDDQFMLVTDARRISDGHSTEKNWMPCPTVGYQRPRYVYKLDTVIQPHADPLAVVTPTKLHVDDIRGSSQLIPWKQGYLCVVHEAVIDPSTGKRCYWHRFVWFNHDVELMRVSLPFVFEAKQIEFCAGLAIHPEGGLIISYGVRDEMAMLAHVDETEVSHLLWKMYE